MAQLNYSKLNDSASERRYLPRWEVNNRIQYQLGPYADQLEGATKDLNSSGASVVVGRDPLVYKRIRMTVYLDKNVSFDVDGNIMWTKKENDQYVLGVRFQNLTPEAQDLILEHAFRIDKKKFLKHLFKGWQNPPA